MSRLATVRAASVALLYFILAAPSYAQVSPALSQKSPDAAEIVLAAQSRGTVRVVIMYQAPVSPARANIGAATEDIPAIINENHAAQDAILSSHFAGPQQASNNALKRFDITPGFAINATLDQINALAGDDRVLNIDIDRTGAPQLIQSVPLIGMTNAYSQGATGSGWAVAVMDTGTETSHTFLTGQTIQEACFSTTQGSMGSGGSTSLCPGGASSSTAVGSGGNCNIAWDGCEHGTHVSGISVGLNSVMQAGQPTNGVAKSARLIAIKMYSEFSGGDCTSVSPCVRFFFSDFVSALDYVYSIRNSLAGGVKIAAINLSGGGGHFSGNCDTASGSPAMKASIDNLRAAGIATVISAGNGSSRTQIGQPGCISSAIAVAASSKTDVIASYSDISSQVALFAPGGDFTSTTAPILSSVPAGFNAASFGFNCNYSGTVPSSGGSYCYLSGTSMAAPHVAGAFAAIRTVCPSSTVDQILTALVNTGTPITDTRSSGTITKNRIQVNAAITQLACGGPVAHTAISDFNGDGKSDILWRGSDGTVAEWLMNGGSYSGVTLAAGVDNSWHIVGTGDFNGDGKSDILWRHDDGSVAIWLTTSGSGFTGASVAAGVDNSWHIDAVGDFNGDGKADILWRHNDGSVAIWFMNGASFSGAMVASGVDPAWHIVGVGDVNGDGKSDILWRYVDGSVATWQMNGASYSGYMLASGVTNAWQIAGLGDFNGDGKCDVLWRYTDGSVAIWQLNGGNSFTGISVAYGVTPAWQIIGTGDFNGDGKSDVLWRYTDGSVATWQMNGGAYSGFNVAYGVSNAWATYQFPVVSASGP